MNISELNKMQLTAAYFKKHLPELYDKIILLPPNKFQEKLYWHQHGLIDYPKCPVCGKIPVFQCFAKGYRKYCSRKCLNNDPLKKEKSKQTCIERYGTEHAMQNINIKEKSKQTCIERYGTEHAMQSQEIKNKSIKTIRSRYGVDWAGSIPGRIEKMKLTCIKRYGGVGYASPKLLKKSQNTSTMLYGDPAYNNPTQTVRTQRNLYGGVGNESPLLRNKYSQTHRTNHIRDIDELIGYTESGEWICKCPHPDCTKCEEKSYIITCNHFYDRKRDNTEPCTHLLPVQNSHSVGTTIELFVRNILDKIGIKYQTNNAIFNGKHADIWIPSMKLAIELNGTYYHSTIFKSKTYHINKYRCAKNKDITLLTFWSDQIYNHPEIVRSIILSKLGKISQTIFARRCEIREVGRHDAADFLESNHIQGSTPTTIRYGLYYNDHLVSLMTFTKNIACQGTREMGQNEWVLNRFCNLINTRVIGGASKLLNHFIKSHDPSKITSFSHNDISTGKLYRVLGFVSDDRINTSYYYIKGNKRWHRATFTKASIVTKGWRDAVASSWTEQEVMSEQKFLCIYDSGTQKWVWTKKELN